MTEAPSLPITVDEDWLAMLSAGTLSPFKQLLLTCQAEMRPDARSELLSSDHVGGALLESAKPAELSDTLMQRLSERLDASGGDDLPAGGEQPSGPNASPDWMPPALADHVRRSGRRLKWRRAGLGVQQARLGRAPNGERLYLLRARPGFPVPRHTHSGQEWTLVLAGGYTAGGRQYVEGDLHQEDETCVHDLRIDDDGPCISLIADDGPLRFPGFLMKLLQPLLGL